MIPDKIDNYVEEAKDRALPQYHNSPRLMKLLEVYAGQYQDLEDLLSDFLNKRSLEEATGDILDRYGLILGWPRYGFSDDEYRDFLRIAVQINIADGTAVHIINTLADLTQSTIRFMQRGTANYDVSWETSDTLSDLFFYRFNRALEVITPLGVSYSAVQGTDTSFQFDTDNRGFDEGGLARRVDNL